jgi:hypothetical protein
MKAQRELGDTGLNDASLSAAARFFTPRLHVQDPSFESSTPLVFHFLNPISYFYVCLETI